MKGKRHTTEDKIRILRAADGGKSIVEICKEKNISEQTFHRWKRQFGMMEVNEAKRLKELERENTELKKMLADSLLENRVLRFVNEKNYEPGAQEADGRGRDGPRPVFRAESLRHPAPGASYPVVSRRAAKRPPAADGRPAAYALRGAPPVWLPPHGRPVAAGRLGGGQAPDPALASGRRSAGAPDQAEDRPAGSLDGPADQGHASGACLDLGLHRRCDGARWRPAHADGPR
jgi:putative transposase